LEVETRPVLAEPVTGVHKETKEPVTVLDNAEEVHGNIVVMTTQGNLDGWKMAQIAKNSGAAALIVVNIDTKHPDDIYRLPLPLGEKADGIDIPVVMMSYNSANVLTSATVTSEMSQDDIVNHGMPERVRLYAGGDRPFFEDVIPSKPVLYLIHNILTPEECDRMIKSAQKKMKSITDDSLLDMLHDTDKFINVQRATLWQGLWQLSVNKAIEERIEQVTAFPAAHFSDFVVDKYEAGSFRKPHYDVFPDSLAMATITIFLNNGEEPSIVYPNAKDPIKIRPKQGMAIVHHNTKDNQMDLDYSTLHAMMPSTGTMLIAQKFVYDRPVSYARRIVVPLFDFVGLMFILKIFHGFCVERFGMEQGSSIFDKACVGVPILLVGLIIQFIIDKVQSKKPEAKKSKKVD
jgi:PA domain